MRGWKSLIHGSGRWLLLVATGMLIPIITNLASSWLEMTVGRTPGRLLQLLALGVAATLALWALNVVLRQKQEPLVLVPSDAQPGRMPGLIALVGRGRPGERLEIERQAAVQAIRYHLGTEEGDGALKVCWLIASSGEKGSVTAAREIGELCAGTGCRVVIREVGNAFSVQEAYDAVQRIYEEIDGAEYRELGIGPEQVICDFTSGTAPMTAGMVLACGQHRPMQYTVGRRARAGEPEIASVPLLVQFKPARRRRRK